MKKQKPEPVQTQEIQMHKCAHADEILGGALLRTEGEELFPGVSNAVIRFVEKDVARTDAEFDAEGIVPIGCGGDVRFNDHKGDRGRIPNTCSALLIAEYLGVSKKPEYAQLLAETVQNDTKPWATRTQLAELVKVINRRRQSTNGSLEVFNWGMMAIDAIVVREKYGYAAIPGEKTLLEMFDLWLSDRFEKEKPDADVIKWMREQFDLSMKNDSSVTELAYVIASFFRRPNPDVHAEQAYDDKHIVGWLGMAFNSMYEEQVEFWQEYERARSSTSIFDVQAMILNGKETSLKAAMTISSSSLALKAMQKLTKPCPDDDDERRADIIFIRRPSRNGEGSNGGFFTNKKSFINLADLTRMVRWYEASDKDKKSGCWTDLGSGGQDKRALNWYYDKQAEALYNGTDTHSAVPSKISNQALLEAVLHAFHPDGVREWCRNRGITLSRGTDKKLYWYRGVRERSHRRGRAPAVSSNGAAAPVAASAKKTEEPEINLEKEYAKLEAQKANAAKENKPRAKAKKKQRKAKK